MTFVGLLRPDCIRIAPPWHTFEQTITGLVDTLATARVLPAAARSAAVEAILRREAEGSTALLDIATGVPHARLMGIGEALVALAVSAPGLYEAVPTVPIEAPIIAAGLPFQALSP